MNPAPALADVPRELAPLRYSKIDLVASDGALIVSVGIVVAEDSFPEIVMWNGDPYLRDQAFGPLAWRRVRPYRLDQGE